MGSLWGGSAAARTVVRDDNLRAELHAFELVALAAFESHDHLAVIAARRKLSDAYAWATWAAPRPPGRRLGDFWACLGDSGDSRGRGSRAAASRWAPHGVGAPPEACSAAPSQASSPGRQAGELCHL